MTGSPLHRDTLALCGVLLEELEGAVRFQALKRRLAEGALHLLDLVSLALAGSARRERLEAADAELQALRGQLRLAYELELLAEEPFLELAEQADAIGRQLGGWLKKLRRDGERAAAGA